MKIKNIIRGLIKEAINRSYGSMNDLAKYRDINLDSPSSLSKARSSQGLKVSDMSDLSKNIPFNKKMEKLYGMILGYMVKKFKLKQGSKEIRERGSELKEFIKNFLTMDEVEKFYYRLIRFNSGTQEYKRICEQFINYMQSGQVSDIDAYDKVGMGDDDSDLTYNSTNTSSYENELVKPIKSNKDRYLEKALKSMKSEYKKLDEMRKVKMKEIKTHLDKLNELKKEVIACKNIIEVLGREGYSRELFNYAKDNMQYFTYKNKRYEDYANGREFYNLLKQWAEYNGENPESVDKLIREVYNDIDKLENEIQIKKEKISNKYEDEISKIKSI
jgi:hypothetical protein